ncbi:GntR family transcriptional regulator [Cupriavidus plantarum]|uniref:GntR family transcriptional regulator n=1 Tax=Cupriavidus plantarum TaxID=942865 RepID=UPI0015CA8A3E|nr:GntR family transcriptional regulator [Cupriavidus plantarum]NYI02312.1 DNA-binding GntR family transcriptional regulator [Cupriavidus plantarum]
MEPRHAELTKALIQDITSGVYPVGSSLPGELELADKYGVSRGTVRVALTRIQELGMVSRKKRAGTRVEASAPQSGEYMPRLSSIEELAQYGAATARRIHGAHDVVMDVDMARHLGCPPGSRWLHIPTARTNPAAPDHPVAWSDVYVTADDGTKIKGKLKTSQGLICELVGQTSGRVVKEIHQTVRAIGIPAALARTLGTEPGAYALEFVRRYYDQSDRLFEVVVSVHPADRFSYSTVLQRQSL